VLNNQLSDEERENIDPNHDPYIIFGYGAKTFSVEPFFSLIHNFRTLLKERSYIFTIGYSFFDPYINNLLLEALNHGGKKLIIVNPIFGPNNVIRMELRMGAGGAILIMTSDGNASGAWSAWASRWTLWDE
jgi:hypothetical protein